MAIITNYVIRNPDNRGIRHWVSFKYDKNLVEKIKTIPGALRSWDNQTKQWGFNDKGWALFCSIPEVQFLGNLLNQSGEEDLSYTPRKTSDKLEKIDWDKFNRPATATLPPLRLWDFQKVAISRAIREKNFGFLFEPGLGKTITSICAAKELLERGEVKQVLIISMIGGILKQWAESLDRMDCTYTIIDGDTKLVDRPQAYSEAKTEFVLTLFTSLLAKGPVGSRKRKAQKKFSQVFRSKEEKLGEQMIIVDELHKLGDVSSKTFKELMLMSKSTKYRSPLTGTIIKSTPEKALLPLRFIAPKVFSNKGTFEEAFCVKEETKFGNKIIGYKNLTRLKELIHSYGMVALKADYLTELPEVLPPKKIIIETSPDSLKVIRSLRDNETLNLIQKKQTVDYAQMQDLYIRIHQALICPHVYSDELKAKNLLVATESLVNTLPGKTIIFTTLIEAAEEISKYLKSLKIDNVVCSGRYKQSEIDERVKYFSESKTCNVLVATTLKMGTGYDTLKVAQNCIIYDFNMMAGDMVQAIDRLVRAGQKNKVSVFEFVQDNPISEMQYKKVKMQQNIITETEDVKLKIKNSVDLSEILALSLKSNLFKG